MIISPPLLKAKEAHETDAAWIERVMTVVDRRGYPVNGHGSWHGGIHIRQTDEGRPAESVRAIADGTIVSLRKSSDKRDLAPFNINADKPNAKGSDDGYVLIKHETEIGSGNDAKVVFYSLYMHLKSLAETVKAGEKVYRKDPLGTPGMVDAVNAFHFQIFCDDDNIRKLTGRTDQKLDISRDGRTDAVYGDIHFYLPVGTKFYDKAPVHNGTSTGGLAERYTSTVPLYASMTLEKGNCTMVTRQENSQIDGKYDLLGEPLVNADGKDYEYNLYKTAMRNYKESPSAGFELLRFGRVINTDHETLVPADAPLWMTVNYPGGKGVVNLADPSIKKFSDADFPHWTGWQLIDDDADTNSQCNSAIIKKLREDGVYDAVQGKLICHFPFEWDKSTFDTRFSWLKVGNEEHGAMQEDDYEKLKAHAGALCFDSGALNSGRLWHFHPAEFIRHFRKCGWLSQKELASLIPKNYKTGYPKGVKDARSNWDDNFDNWTRLYCDFNKSCRKYNITSKDRLSCFLGQVYIETNLLDTVREYGKAKKFKGKWAAPAMEYYQPFYGRGLMQLTWPRNYESYQKYRTVAKLPDVSADYSYVDSRITTTTEHYWSDPRVVTIDKLTKKKIITINETLKKRWFPRFDPELIASDSYCACDSAGFYWVSKHHNGKININTEADNGVTTPTIGSCSKLVNGGGYGYFERQAYTRYIDYYLNDVVKSKLKENIEVTYGNQTVNVSVDYTRQVAK
ncbi:M23 family peptidase [Erwinia endophytica]|uniref:M23 family metallopeptidase n=1 Tax=Erwinia endophytica TaxID=1563158 RepID=UPI001265F07C|nr:M23 family metallopeptidase [Erwinia endophytica]KAB8312826.1 M23 family peptidase [Erwinia endophytica]